jgi:hypothetical protein
VKIYIEGGECHESEFRKAFKEFFKKAGLTGQLPKVVVGKGRDMTLDKYRTAINNNENAMLLVDSEAPVSAENSNGFHPWAHLCERDGWEQPAGSDNESCHLMVQCMESWFLADVPALEQYYGAGFRARLLENLDVEMTAKEDVYTKLRQATRNTKKGQYHKGHYSFDILASINPDEVVNKSPWAQRLIQSIKHNVDA